MEGVRRMRRRWGERGVRRGGRRRRRRREECLHMKS
jgi:hypothetical protein